MENKIKKLFVTIVFLIMLFFMIATLNNNNDISDVERRSLTTFPKFTINSILSKTFYEDLTSAFSDQLALRKYLIKGYFLFHFQHYYGDVVIGSNNELYSAPQKDIPEDYFDDLKRVTIEINKVASNSTAKLIFLSIPRKDAYMRKDLPKTYNSSYDIYNKAKEVVVSNLNKNIIFIDAMEVFDESGIYNCYYSNDHHVTPRCSYLLYKKINKYTGVSNYDLEEMFKVNKTIVNGAYNRQLGQTVKSKPEDLFITPIKEIKYKRYENGKISTKKIYGSGNTYEDAYMEGDMAYTKVVTDNYGKNIMFVGSSFTNILEALSIPSYNTVVSIDYRHNKTGKTIEDYVVENKIDYVVYMPAQSNNSFSPYQMMVHLGK